MTRKPIQIAARPEGETTAAVTVALCDDGTIWALSDDGRTWVRLPDVPTSDGRE